MNIIAYQKELFFRSIVHTYKWHERTVYLIRKTRTHAHTRMDAWIIMLLRNLIGFCGSVYIKLRVKIKSNTFLSISYTHTNTYVYLLPSFYSRTSSSHSYIIYYIGFVTTATITIRKTRRENIHPKRRRNRIKKRNEKKCVSLSAVHIRSFCNTQSGKNCFGLSDPVFLL